MNNVFILSNDKEAVQIEKPDKIPEVSGDKEGVFGGNQMSPTRPLQKTLEDIPEEPDLDDELDDDVQDSDDKI